MTGTEPRITWASWLMVAVLGLTWGATFLVTEVALTGITPFWLAAGRITFAALLAWPLWKLLGGRLFAARPSRGTVILVLIIAALSTTVPFTLLAWGQQHVTGGFAGVTMSSVGLIVLPMAHVMIPGEQMSLRRTFGFAVGFVGVCILIGAQAFDTTGSDLEWAGRMACIGAAGCYGVSSVLMRRLPDVDPVGLATVMLIIAVPLSVPLALAMEGAPPMPDARTLGVIAFLGLVPTAAANVLRVLVIRTAGPVFMSLTNYFVPLWSVLLGVWLLAEPLPPSLISACVLILGGVCISQIGALTRLFSSR